MTDHAGALLVRAGLITQAQLDVAYQALRSGGGVLVEQLVLGGAVDEARLCAFFSERMLVPTVSRRDLERLTGELTRLVPAAMATAFRAVPVARDAGRLVVAFADPSHTHAVDELEFHTGLVVQRAVAAPSAIAWALRTFYAAITPLASAGPTTPSRRRAEAVGDFFDEDTPLPAPVPFDETGGRVVLVDPAALGFGVAPRVGVAPGAPPVTESSPNADRALAEAHQLLAQAADSDAVARALVAYLRRLCRRAAFFVMRRGELGGWLGNGIGVHIESLRAALLSFARPSTFRDVARTRLAFRGPLRDAVSRDFLIDALGWAPASMLAIPIAARARVVGILYGDEQMHALPDEHLITVARSAQAALERAVRS